MLTAYMRYKYPHIIDGGVASSAPFFTVAGNSPRSQFWESVTRVSYIIFNIFLPQTDEIYTNTIFWK